MVWQNIHEKKLNVILLEKCENNGWVFRNVSVCQKSSVMILSWQRENNFRMIDLIIKNTVKLIFGY